MTTSLMPEPRQRYYTNLGAVAAGYLLYTYAAGTTTLKATYQDSAGTVPNANPITLDAKGEAVIYWDGSYKVDLKTAAGVPVTGYPVDNYQSFNAAISASDTALRAALAALGGASMVGSAAQHVATITAFNATGVPDGTVIIAKGRDTVGDGGGGIFRYSAASVQAADGGTVFVPFVGAGRLFRDGWTTFGFNGRVLVQWFGAKGDGVADDAPKINTALASFVFAGELGFTRGAYLLGSSVKTSLSGMQLVGDGPSDTYFKTAAGSFDLLKVAGSYTRVTGINFRPGGNQLCMRVYAAHCTIINNRCLAATNNIGTGILLTDTDPDTAGFVAGAYTHRIDNNVIGVSGFAFAVGIDDGSASGIQACDMIQNQIYSDIPIRITRGGGNTYFGNLLQSSTGTVGVPAGSGIDLGANVNGEKVLCNYMERFTQGTLLRNLSNANQVAYNFANHYDSCTNDLVSLGTTNYILESDKTNIETRNGWSTNYASLSLWLLKNSTGRACIGADGSGNVFIGDISGANHLINKIGAVQGDVILSVNGASTNAAYFQYATGTAPNGANTGMAIKANSVTTRSINAGGTVNASGTDYAEYVLKALGCGAIAKGQIVGINADGHITDKWAEAITFMVKTTNPSYVGGDTWFDEPKPEAPHDGDLSEFEVALAAWEARLEAARQTVDRIAFAGQAPVNVMSATPGQYVVPVQDGDGIKGVLKSEDDLTLKEYMRAVGKVIAIESDGRARIIVKVA